MAWALPASPTCEKELGVEDSLKDVPGVTTQMLVAFGEHGIKSIEDLADCGTDDLDGWSESKDGKTIMV
jgi:transcription termination/antitermination protein NusA